MYHLAASSQDTFALRCPRGSKDKLCCRPAAAVLKESALLLYISDASMTPLIPRTDLTAVTVLLCAHAPAAFAQGRGRLAGRVLDSPGTMPKGVEGAVVVAVNQVSARAYRARTKSDGTYSLSLPAGAYRVRLEAPFKASFDGKVKYGPFAIARGDAVENIGVEPGRDTTLDIVLAQKEGTPAPTAPAPGGGDENDPAGYAGRSGVEAEAPTAPDRVPVRDRWRIGFP